jgi:hypothetical protein
MNQYDVSSYAHGQGLVSRGQARALQQREKSCQAKLQAGSYMNGQCWDLLDDVVKQSGGAGKPKVSKCCELYRLRLSFFLFFPFFLEGRGGCVQILGV